ncbi:uncharacterized protein LOC127279634 isoform X2 [Leptopilina boulardi]|uniref:uncharacterized protein LOC127279634 isoform X2 n=1 Tax=Leptopilina boulardi TaxID=63433 RepID=UPI0021F57F06|nr:uncharacterized protein LOC127279634 isoform X2 [Leptopilina boulardi]
MTDQQDSKKRLPKITSRQQENMVQWFEYFPILLEKNFSSDFDREQFHLKWSQLTTLLNMLNPLGAREESKWQKALYSWVAKIKEKNAKQTSLNDLEDRLSLLLVMSESKKEKKDVGNNLPSFLKKDECKPLQFPNNPPTSVPSENEIDDEFEKYMPQLKGAKSTCSDSTPTAKRTKKIGENIQMQKLLASSSSLASTSASSSNKNRDHEIDELRMMQHETLQAVIVRQQE